MSYRTFSHGYAVTSHAAQGKTVDEVMVVASSQSFPAVSQESFYVSISRARGRARIYTAQAPDACHAESMADPVAFVDFWPDARTRTGFSVSQLYHYTLDANPDADDKPDAPRERLTLAFSTADVVMVGLRLAHLIEPLQKHRLVSVAAMDARYAHAGEPKPWVAKITIGPPGKT